MCQYEEQQTSKLQIQFPELRKEVLNQEDGSGK